jgi:L-alanine-DL-glutamate epimerase-like enolase superfamily enzyme
MPWSQRLWIEVPRIEDGLLVVPPKPGLGLAFDRSTVPARRAA